LAIVEPLGTVYLEHHPYPENIFWLIEFSNTSLTLDGSVDAEAAGCLSFCLQISSKNSSTPL
jgi:hypothetical protein